MLSIKAANRRRKIVVNAGRKGGRETENKAGYTATEVACGWAGAKFKATPSFGQEQYGQRPQKPKKSKV